MYVCDSCTMHYNFAFVFSVSLFSNTCFVLSLHLPLLRLLWRIGMNQSEEQSTSHHYTSKYCYGNCSLCAHRNLRNGSVSSCLTSSGVMLTRVVFPLKHKCCGMRSVQFIIHNLDGSKVCFKLLLLAGDVEINPGPGIINCSTNLL